MEKMLKTRGSNYLLVKGDLGRGRPATIPLPGDDFVYGNPNRYDRDAIKQCMLLIYKLTNFITLIFI